MLVRLCLGDVDVEFLCVFPVFCGVQHLEGLGDGAQAHEAGEADVGSLVPGALLGGDEDDTVGCAGTVDGCGGGVLQDLHGLDVVGGEVCDCIAAFAHGNAVNHVERVVGRGDGTGTANADGHAGTRLAGGLLHLDAGNLALDEAGSLGDGPELDVFGRDD